MNWLYNLVRFGGEQGTQQSAAAAATNTDNNNRRAVAAADNPSIQSVVVRAPTAATQHSRQQRQHAQREETKRSAARGTVAAAAAAAATRLPSNSAAMATPKATAAPAAKTTAKRKESIKTESVKREVKQEKEKGEGQHGKKVKEERVAVKREREDDENDYGRANNNDNNLPSPPPPPHIASLVKKLKDMALLIDQISPPISASLRSQMLVLTVAGADGAAEAYQLFRHAAAQAALPSSSPVVLPAAAVVATATATVANNAVVGNSSSRAAATTVPSTTTAQPAPARPQPLHWQKYMFHTIGRGCEASETVYRRHDNNVVVPRLLEVPPAYHSHAPLLQSGWIEARVAAKIFDAIAIAPMDLGTWEPASLIKEVQHYVSSRKSETSNNLLAPQTVYAYTVAAVFYAQIFRTSALTKFREARSRINKTKQTARKDDNYDAVVSAVDASIAALERPLVTDPSVIAVLAALKARARAGGSGRRGRYYYGYGGSDDDDDDDEDYDDDEFDE